MFIDYVEIEIFGGNGGAGCISFHTEKYKPKGGPDGGDGGRGGDVVAVANPQLSTLLDYRYKKFYRADNGKPGTANLCSGKSGENIELNLPVGTLIKDMATGQIIGDLDVPGASMIIAKGGRGGKGNAFFKSSTNQAPRMAQDGEAGYTTKIALELKLLADVGLVGLPNAGKSTILASFSAARPKIADYPFTTLVPNLGIVRFREMKSCVMADIPGLIEGASQGKGLGIQFLKHIQRTRLLVFVVDINEEDISATRQLLETELSNFDPTLLTKPSVTVITKADTMDESDTKSIFDKLPSDYILLSAVTRQGAEQFLQILERCLDQYQRDNTPS